ncbi:hypothetical protein ES703_124141 [subsurface metagenome]
MVWHPNNGRVHYLGVLHQQILNGLRVYVLTTTYDHILLPTLDNKPAILTP